MSSELKIINNRYQLGKKIGSGSFGIIFDAYDMKQKYNIAIKFESYMCDNPQLTYEYKIYKHLQGFYGIPKVYEMFKDKFHNEKYYGMSMDLFESSLENKFQECNCKFSLKTVCSLAIEMLKIIKEIHNNSIIHRDLKPDNFLIDKDNSIYICDFGLSKLFRDSKTHEHILYKENKTLTGTPRYVSINNHLGVQQSRRDDLESLMYVLIYFYNGKLPWQGLKEINRKKKNQIIMEKKLSIPIPYLCRKLPDEFSTYLEYARCLRFTDTPDYDALIKLFLDVSIKNGFTIDRQYDWVNLLQPIKENDENMEISLIDATSNNSLNI
jgi:serine/threonine protein kinase